MFTSPKKILIIKTFFAFPVITNTEENKEICYLIYHMLHEVLILWLRVLYPPPSLSRSTTTKTNCACLPFTSSPIIPYLLMDSAFDFERRDLEFALLDSFLMGLVSPALKSTANFSSSHMSAHSDS